ncbi:hypothetical protein Pelo_15334 [Pelomyxa schiedti]|nr:hypothetical protein Pelo_15334 [Pelomyxa schiedti]
MLSYHSQAIEAHPSDGVEDKLAVAGAVLGLSFWLPILGLFVHLVRTQLGSLDLDPAPPTPGRKGAGDDTAGGAGAIVGLIAGCLAGIGTPCIVCGLAGCSMLYWHIKVWWVPGNLGYVISRGLPTSESVDITALAIVKLFMSASLTAYTLLFKRVLRVRSLFIAMSLFQIAAGLYVTIFLFGAYPATAAYVLLEPKDLISAQVMKSSRYHYYSTISDESTPSLSVAVTDDDKGCGVDEVVRDCGMLGRTRVAAGAYGRACGSMLCIMGMVVLWLVLAYSLQGMETTQSNPLFTAWLVHASYVMFAGPWFLWKIFHWKRHKSKALSSLEDASPISCKNRSRRISNCLLYVAAAFILNLIAVACSYTWYLSLPRTSIAGNTAVYNSACAIVFVLSVIILHEKVALSKILAVSASVVGAVSVSCSESIATPRGTEGDSPVEMNGKSTFITQGIVGYLLVFSSTVLFALYEVLYSKFEQWWTHRKNQQNNEDKDFTTPILSSSELITEDSSPPDTITIISSSPSILPLNSTSIREPYVASNPVSQSKTAMTTTEVAWNAVQFLWVLGACNILSAIPVSLILILIPVTAAATTGSPINATAATSATWLQQVVPTIASGEQLRRLAGVCAADSAFAAFTVVAIALSRAPTLVSAGSLLAIPAAVACDAALGRGAPRAASACGAALIAAGHRVT